MLSKCCIGEVLEWYRGEDAGDLKRSGLHVLVVNWTCLKVPRRMFFSFFNNSMILVKEKRWKTWKSYQKIVMDEELVQNGVMDEEFVNTFVMRAKIYPKVEYGQIIKKENGKWNILQSRSRKLSEFLIEIERRLSIGIPSRDSFFMIQYLDRLSCGLIFF